MRRNVLQLISGFWEGGSERQAVQLTRLLVESGRFNVHVACLYGGGPLRAEVERLGLEEIAEFPLTSFYDRNALGQWRRFARYLREREIHLLHANEFYTNIFGMMGAALARTQTVRVASRRETGGTRTPMQKRVERVAYRLSDAIVANAEAVRRHLAGEGVPAEKIEVIYNGLDMARVTPDASLRREEVLESFQLPRSGRRFVTIVANLRLPVKDHPMFLRAAARVRQSVADAAFVLAGEGDLTGEMRSLATQLGLTDRDVFFTGRCERIAELLSVSDVCVLSSKAEGFSNAILEYMAAGRAVVATDVGGARETIIEGETGYLVASGDDEAMAGRIAALLKEPERARRMGERGRQVVEEKFSCAAQIERTERLYERLLERLAGEREQNLRVMRTAR